VGKPSALLSSPYKEDGWTTVVFEWYVQLVGRPKLRRPYARYAS
jgi:hypothetical protein